MWLAELEAISDKEHQELLQEFESTALLSSPQEATVLLAAKSEEQLSKPLKSLGLITKLKRISNTEKEPLLATKKWKRSPTIVDCGSGVAFGGKELPILAGPCAVESEEQLDKCATHLKSLGAQVLRAGAYKPRTSPYSFQGKGAVGMELLSKVAKQHGMLSVSEVMDEESLEVAADTVDILQIGSRNMFNYALLKKASRQSKPILLKRGFSATYQEWLLAAEYLLCGGNERIILCERGIRTFESHTRFTLDINAVAVIKELSHLPIVVDPSHGTGNTSYIHRVSRAAVAAGCDGVMLEVHPDPEAALSDAGQALCLSQSQQIISDLSALHRSVFVV